jgi:hypothetical protein
VKYIPNLRICMTMICSSTMFSFLHPKVSCCLPTRIDDVFTSVLDIRKGLFHETRFWVHIGDMVAYYHPSLCRFENYVMVYSGGYYVSLLGDSSKCRGIKK